MRPSTGAAAILVTLALAFLACFGDAHLSRERRADEVVAMRVMAAQLGLTDLALFTEARYTRHPSQADLNSAFQDHALALEHFPSGSLIPPRHERLVHKTETPD
ncbi:MAG: hypothetical protein HZA64_03555 [Rhodocyclales bacterium]|nr:hypothetical protein [Rhodocyclales bacterium]